MKTLLTTAALVLTMATASQAQDMFARMEAPQDENSTVIVIDAFSATDDGFVAIYDYNREVVGDLLGVASIRSGANRETRVRLGHPVRNDVIAFLFSGSDFSDPATAIDSVEINIDG